MTRLQPARPLAPSWRDETKGLSLCLIGAGRVASPRRFLLVRDVAVERGAHGVGGEGLLDLAHDRAVLGLSVLCLKCDDHVELQQVARLVHVEAVELQHVVVGNHNAAHALAHVGNVLAGISRVDAHGGENDLAVRA